MPPCAYFPKDESLHAAHPRLLQTCESSKKERKKEKTLRLRNDQTICAVTVHVAEFISVRLKLKPTSLAPLPRNVDGRPCFILLIHKQEENLTHFQRTTTGPGSRLILLFPQLQKTGIKLLTASTTVIERTRKSGFEMEDDRWAERPRPLVHT
jgi:hypothetical protein